MTFEIFETKYYFVERLSNFFGFLFCTIEGTTITMAGRTILISSTR
jgi:hypothetical protein